MVGFSNYKGILWVKIQLGQKGIQWRGEGTPAPVSFVLQRGLVFPSPYNLPETGHMDTDMNCLSLQAASNLL